MLVNMLVSVSDLKKYFGVPPSAVLHVGAGNFEELDEYKAQGFSPVIWIDCHPNTNLISRERVKFPDSYINACVGSENGIQLAFTLAGGSSSIYERKGHDKIFPETISDDQIFIASKRLDSLLSSQECPRFVNMDCEGSELAAILGLGNLVTKIEYFYLEVSRPGWGEHPDYREVHRYLVKQGFKRLGMFWYWNTGFGDALYKRKEVKLSTLVRIRSFYFLSRYNWRRAKDFVVRAIRNRKHLNFQ